MNTLKNVRHCRYCDLHEFEISKGVICSLTGENGMFERKCPSINFDINLQNKIFEIEGDLSYFKYLKPRAFLQFYVLLTIGILIHVLNYFITNVIYDMGFISTLSIIIFIVGIIVLGIAIGSLRFYFRKKSTILPKKEELELITSIYNLNYKFDYNISSDLLGNERGEFILHIDGKELNRTINFNKLKGT